MTAATLARHVSIKVTPQSQPIFGTSQVKNSAGGYVHAVDCWTRMRRFLILGSDGGSYYASERKLTQEAAKSVIECAKEHPFRAVNMIVEISDGGKAPKNDPAIFALAMLAGGLGGKEAQDFALEALPKVCRIGTHLFQFTAAVTEFRGWGRALRTAVAKWYTDRTPDECAFQMTKYQQRNGWSHGDLLRLSHPKWPNEHNAVFRWALGGTERLGKNVVVRKLSDGSIRTDEYHKLTTAQLPDLCLAFEEAKNTTSDVAMARLIREEGLVREHVPTHFLNSTVVWEALLEKMPIHAMVRNLGKMTSIGLIAPLNDGSRQVCDKLRNANLIKKSRMHPLALLMAMKVYEQGKGDKGSLRWSPVSQVVDALNDAFYTAFDNVESTNKRWLLALDVSGSMTWGTIAGSSLTPRDASAAMALVTASTESQHHIVGFTSGGHYSSALKPLAISPRQRLTDAVRAVSDLPFGGTDCALPMIYAEQNRIPVDAFVVYTDSETWAGNIHPSQALRSYRNAMGIDAKLIVVSMMANEFSIADPNDAGMLDVVGFDTSVPSVMADFVSN